MEVVSFVEREKKVECERKFNEYWKGRVAGAHWVAYGPKPCPAKAALMGRFQFGIQLENSSLPSVLDALSWNNPEKVLFFDDIALAPFMPRYGANAILSPHDCMSRMFWSHFRGSCPKLGTARYLLQSLMARRYERTYYHRALLIHVITPRDRVWLEAINPKARYAVVPNSDMLNPGFSVAMPNSWDVLVWGDIHIGSVSHGTRAFLTAARDQGWLTKFRVLVVGRVAVQEARKIIGADLLSLVTYMPRLEDNQGQLQHAKITVVPDTGGAGIKNRCVTLLSSGKCLACLYPQMEGVEKACDRGAINAMSQTELATKIENALWNETWPSYALTGQAVFKREYSETANRQLWVEMVERAVAIRSGWR